MILDLITSYSTLSKKDFSKQKDDDGFDKLSRKYSATMMVIGLNISKRVILKMPLKNTKIPPAFPPA